MHEVCESVVLWSQWVLWHTWNTDLEYQFKLNGCYR